MKLIKEMLELIEAQQEWIMAVPREAAAKFPAMPGFDGDWADDVRARAKIVVQHTADTECKICGDGEARAQVTRYCDNCTSEYAGVGEYLAGKILQ